MRKGTSSIKRAKTKLPKNPTHTNLTINRSLNYDCVISLEPQLATYKMSSSYETLLISTILLSISSITSSDANFSDTLLEPVTPVEKTTKLHFYLHDIVSGPNPTSVEIIGKGYGFGATFMIDDALTQGPDRASKIIGRAEGMYSSASRRGTAVLMVVVFAFTDGVYNGSSLSMVGINRIFEDVREMPIVGGSGVFRFARGYALARTFRLDLKTGDAIVEYNVSIKHA